MKAQPSYQCNVKADIKPSLEDVSDGIDLSKCHGERREDRKNKQKLIKRRTDDIHFVDLPGTANYDDFFNEFIDDKLSLNIKGPFANLFWKFSVVNEAMETSNERRVRLFLS